jgi:hypothetical protein
VSRPICRDSTRPDFLVRSVETIHATLLKRVQKADRTHSTSHTSWLTKFNETCVCLSLSSLLLLIDNWTRSGIHKDFWAPLFPFAFEDGWQVPFFWVHFTKVTKTNLLINHNFFYSQKTYFPRVFFPKKSQKNEKFSQTNSPTQYTKSSPSHLFRWAEGERHSIFPYNLLFWGASIVSTFFVFLF